MAYSSLERVEFDGVSVGEPDEFALRDRRKLSDDGVFIVVATISSDDGSQVADQQTEHLLLKREIEKFRRESQSPETDPPKDHP